MLVADMKSVKPAVLKAQLYTFIYFYRYIKSHVSKLHTKGTTDMPFILFSNNNEEYSVVRMGDLRGAVDYNCNFLFLKKEKPQVNIQFFAL